MFSLPGYVQKKIKLLKNHFLSHGLGMRGAVLRVGLQNQHPAILVAQPAGNRGNIDPALETSRGKQMS